MVLVAASLCAVSTARAQRPNVVLFIADDLGVGDVAPYGSQVAHTPNLARLAGESLRFTRAFAASPTCTPSRSATYTGLMPLRNGAHPNHGLARAGTRSLPHYLEPLGYRVALAGKLHVGPRDVFPFELVPGSNVPEPGKEGQGVLWTDLETDAVDRWLGGLPAGQPFLLVLGEHSPHTFWPEVPAYDPGSVDVPATHLDTPTYRRARARYLTDVTKMDRNVGRILDVLDRRGLAENTLVVFVSDQGSQFPGGKWTLYDAGVRVPMLVRWPGRVEGGRSTDAMVSLVDLLPTFVEAAGGRPPEGIDGRSLLGLLEGRAETHREEVFAAHTGDRAINRAPARMLRTDRYKYILNLAPDSLVHTYDVVRTADYWASWRERAFRDDGAAALLWRHQHRPAEELYDLVNDPEERRDLAADPAHAALLKEMRRRLASWRAGQGDAETGPEPLVPDAPRPSYIF